MVGPRSRPRWVALAFFGACFLLVVFLNWQRGAFSSGLGGYNDEAAHAISGIMIRDYLVQREPLDPLAYAKGYYLHYPKVAVGQWPPVFHTLLALWMLLFGVSRVALILFSSAVSALVAMLIREVLRRELSDWLTVTAGLLFLLVPVVQSLGSVVMTEVLLALFCLLAVLSFGRLIDRNRLVDGLLFGGCALLAILTKGNGLALALVPPFAILLSRRWGLLRSRPMWASAGLVVLACSPWYYLTLEISRGTWGGGNLPSWGYASAAARSYAGGLLAAGGWITAGLCLIGLFTRLADREAPGMWRAAAAWLLAWTVMHLLAPTSIEPRHLISLLPIWFLFAAAGAHWLARRFPWPAVRVAGAIAVVWSVMFALEAFEYPQKRLTGFDRAVTWLLAREEHGDSVILVDSDQIGEGLAITEVALAEERVGHYVLRGTKILSTSDWLGRYYKSRHDTTEEMAAHLREIPVRIVLFDRSGEPSWLMKHHRLLEETLREDPNWTLVRTFDVARESGIFEGGLEVWEQRGVAGGPAGGFDFGGVSGRTGIDYPW